MDYDTLLRLQAAMNFLDSHVALTSDTTGSFFSGNFTFVIDGCCALGIPAGGDAASEVTVAFEDSSPEFEGWSQRHPDAVDEYMKGNTARRRVHVKYHELYGHPWVFHHAIYCGSFCIVRAEDNALPGLYEGKYLKAPTFEELILATTEWVKENLGNFDSAAFLTDDEKQNNRENEPWLLQSNGELKNNPDYIVVPWEVLNRRWWDWFAKTPLYQMEYAVLFRE